LSPEKNIEIIFQKLLKNECSPGEAEELVKHLGEKGHEKAEELILKQLEESVSPDQISEEVKMKLQAGLGKILNSQEAALHTVNPAPKMPQAKKLYRISIRYAAAITLVFLTVIAWYIIKINPEPNHFKKAITSAPLILDFEPGSNKAILMTDDGNTVYLDETIGDNSAYKGIAEINPEEGLIAFNNLANSGQASIGSEEISYNTIIIPRGGQYKITLSDGTKVWLNSASSLRFPEVFEGKERVVELSGEGYFEVAKNADMPFKVMVNQVEVNVLGTHFNVNAYEDNKEIKTTLLEGSVAISTGNQKVTLQPGQEVSYSSNKLGKVISGANVDQVIAWKNDHFDFTNETLQNISKQLSRWYQVEMSIEEKLAKKQMSGIISRKNNISKVLEVLEISAGISSKVEGNKVFLYKK
jgi:hypothetical protein